MEYKRIIVLAKSYKPGGWCVAGKEVDYQEGVIRSAGGWIRPVSGDEENHGSLTETQCCVDGGGAANVYDVIDIPLSGHDPTPGQPENYRIEDGMPWQKVDYIAPGNVRQLEDTPNDVWLEGGIATDRISSEFDESGRVNQSLYLIRPEAFRVALSNDLNIFSGRYKKDIRASFTYCGTDYGHISITDPRVRKAFENLYPEKDGAHVEQHLPMGDNCLICLSLGPRFGGRQEHYKLVATVLDFTGYYQSNFR